MRTRTRIFVLAFLIALALSLSLYVAKVHEVAAHAFVFENALYWPSTGYSLFPRAYTPEDWPPGFGFIQTFIRLTPTESFIAEQLVDTSFLTLAVASLWIATGIFGAYVGRGLKDTSEKRSALLVTLCAAGVACIVTSFFASSDALHLVGLMLWLSVGLVVALRRRRVFAGQAS